MYRDLFVEIDVDKIQNNIKNIIKKHNDYEYYIGVVKGNSYGHGPYLVKYLEEAGINYFAVSNLDEALMVRKYTKKPILCLEPIDLKYMDIVSKNNITITISSYDYYKKLIKLDYKLNAHLKINTGMNRLGISSIDEIKEIYDKLIDHDKIKLEGIYTHFATTGIRDKMYDNQVNKFLELTSSIDLDKLKIIHLGRSSALQLHPKLSFANGIRLGIIMYGIGQSFNRYLGLKGKLRKIKDTYIIKKNNISKVYSSSNLKLDTGFSLKTSVVEIQKIKRGDKVGYGCTYTALHDTNIAVCEIGYADGLSLKYKDSKVSINGKLYNIVGIVNMGMITIEVDDSIKIGDIVTIIGNDINIKKVASLLGVTPYVVMTSIDSKIKRVYVKNNKIDKIV